jgi:anti-anti-sigma factor
VTGDLTLHAEERGDRTVVTPAGTVDYWTAGPLRKLLESAAAMPDPRIVLDLRQVPFMDSTGLALLVAADRWTRERGGWLRLAGPSDHLRRMLDITNLDRRLRVCDDVAAAMNGSGE